jgi:ATP-dependent DNA helicase RecG
MLVCGKNIFHFLESRCQVDCFVTSPIQIAGNKKIFKDNIISLLEYSIGFVFTNIETGISAEKGGKITFEYPERLIRETVNNALAHRDYSINKFINITIQPGKLIEIRNPGRFRREQLMTINSDVQIRRIIPIPKAQNPRLADVLKTFDRWEGKGWGMSSLTNMALENQIDLPYYILYNDEDVGLTIPKGRVYDDEMNSWLKSFDGYIYKKTNGKDLTEEQLIAMSYFFKSERVNKIERYTIALTPDNNHFSVISDLEQWGLIVKHPESPVLHPIYIVDRVLVKLDFTNELRLIYGGIYDSMKPDYKAILNAIYHFNNFGRDSVYPNSSEIGRYIFNGKNRIAKDINEFNELQRSVRRIVNRLTENNIIIKSENGKRPGYILNLNVERKLSLFD